MTLCACGLSLFWIWFESRDATPSRERRIRTDLLIVLVLGAMELWLLRKAQSATALACTLLGGGIILAARFPNVRKHFEYLGIVLFSILGVALVLHMISGIGTLLVQALGRDVTLTGRTEIWNAVLQEKINVFAGEGYYSFWQGDRATRLSAEYHYELNQAHNGYLETYLNSGLIGLFLLFAMMSSGGRRIKIAAMSSDPFGGFRLACFTVIAVYAVTEAVFNRLNPIWFLLLLVMLTYKPARKSIRIG
jgi:exopolysaccharide production protein ExoQ